MHKVALFIITILVISLSVACFGGDDEAETEPDAAAVAAQSQTEPTNTPVPPTATPIPPTTTPLPTPKPVQALGATSPLEAPSTELRSGSSPIPVPSADTDRLISQAREILGTMFQVNIAADQIVLRALDEQAWPDSSLGCPKEGEAYTQMITPGYRLILEMNGETYEFHTDLNEQVVACFELP